MFIKSICILAISTACYCALSSSNPLQPTIKMANDNDKTIDQLSEDASFLKESQIKDLPSVAALRSVVITPIKPKKSVKNSADVKATGPSKQLSPTQLETFKRIFSNPKNFRFTPKKKSIFIAEFMASFPDYPDLFLFVSLSTNQIEVLKKDEYEIFELSTSFESSAEMAIFLELFSLGDKIAGLK